MDAIYCGVSWYWLRPLAQDIADRGFMREIHSSWVCPEDLALLIAIAKQLPDDPDDFPKGKWASIQHLEDLLAQHINKALKGEEG